VKTRIGEIELDPKKRQGLAYFPSFLEPRRRSEQAIVAVVLEAYVNGVSTRKVDRSYRLGRLVHMGASGLADRTFLREGACTHGLPSKFAAWVHDHVVVEFPAYPQTARTAIVRAVRDRPRAARYPGLLGWIP
jgi:Transposase, Mutator family